MSASNTTRLNQALALLVQSPPGQTSQVYHDLRGILFDAESNASDKIDDAALQSAAAIALEEYNTHQLVTATLPSAGDAPVIICQAGQVAAHTATPGVKRYLHPKLNKTFLFDHVKRTVSDVKDATVVHPEVEKTRSALEKALEAYVKDRYPDGVSSVFAVSSVPVKDEEQLKEEVAKAAVEDAKLPAENTGAVAESEADDGAAEAKDDDTEIKDDPIQAVAAAEAVSSTNPAPPTATTPPQTTYTLHHVGNRFNLSNFWSGRWRASYTLDPAASPPSLTSTVSVQVHYFENGNVQLNAAKPRTFHLSGGGEAEALAREVAGVIAAHEDAWQTALEKCYDELAERAFKALRRQLPLTRQKVDWDKVLNYKLGDELAR
ncbi:related to CAP1-F-actin capping protein alpha subunit [Sporisorium reilianum f. sp. reilianum]|uniref:Related to CAP1-F-actin capping protein alpha subunit n=1 Tax=Sporisorium reilianum f. sp. reilianum TaxID=72559 RepID=A0A2N8U740_9BASI|nr:related to CAP1-F-actin capping protein alpha subunit [Sporisorium reilianum f. sp. reilianum]